jgi:NAD(P)H dehydrogenase (quinone)
MEKIFACIKRRPTDIRIVMYAVMGVTGQVGGATARSLLGKGAGVRAVARDASKTAAWVARGCEPAVADLAEPNALAEAFRGADAAFVMVPSMFDPSPGFPEALKAIAALRDALDSGRPGRVVVLSTIGAQVETPNLLYQLHLLEEGLGTLPLPITFLRPAWFMENTSWDIAPARESGVAPSFLQPLDQKFPMIATQDIGQVAAELLVESWTGKRVVEIEGPSRISPNEIAAALTQALNRNVRMQAVARDTWEPLFLSQGMKNPAPRMQMLDGFNAGWIEFEGVSRKMHTPFTEVVRSLIQQQAA